MNALTPIVLRGLRWVFPTPAPVSPGDAAADQVTRAMDQRRWWDREPRAVAGELGLSWSLGDEERWHGEFARCPGCRCWVSGPCDALCQCCLTC